MNTPRRTPAELAALDVWLVEQLRRATDDLDRQKQLAIDRVAVRREIDARRLNAEVYRLQNQFGKRTA